MIPLAAVLILAACCSAVCFAALAWAIRQGRECERIREAESEAPEMADEFALYATGAGAPSAARLERLVRA